MKRREREKLMELIRTHELVVSRSRELRELLAECLVANARLERRRRMLAERLARARLNVVMLTEELGRMRDELEREQAAGRDTAMLDHPSAPDMADAVWGPPEKLETILVMFRDPFEVVDGRVRGVPGTKPQTPWSDFPIVRGPWDMENDGGPSF